MHQMSGSYEKLHIDAENRSALILGYRVHLTSSECALLCAVASDSGIATERILSECFEGKELKPVNVAVHVFNINQKAYAITGRKLIVGNRKSGYRIVDNI